MSRSLAALLCALLLGSAAGAAHEQTEKRDGVIAQLRAESVPPSSGSADGKLEVSLSGELVLTLTIEAPRGVEVAPRPAIASSKAWRQRNTVTGWETAVFDDGRVRRRQTYRLTPWQPGEAVLPLLPLRFRKERGSNDWEEIIFKPIPVVVTTMLRDADLSSARDITGIEELPTVEKSYGWLLGLAGGLVVLVCGAVVWLLWRLRIRSVRVPTPDERALHELARLAEWPLHTAADGETFAIQLSEILRRYLEERFGFHAPQQTTVEFLSAVGQSPQLAPGQQELLREVLEQCDLAKFARVQVPAEQCRQGVARLRTFVEETRPPQTGGRYEPTES